MIGITLVTTRSPLPAQPVGFLVHFIRRPNNPRVCFVSPLAQDHGDELFDHADVGTLKETLLQAAQPVLTHPADPPPGRRKLVWVGKDSCPAPVIRPDSENQPTE